MAAKRKEGNGGHWEEVALVLGHFSLRGDGICALDSLRGRPRRVAEGRAWAEGEGTAGRWAGNGRFRSIGTTWGTGGAAGGEWW